MFSEFSIHTNDPSVQQDVATLIRHIHSPPLIGYEKKLCGLINQLVARGDPAIIPVIAHGLFTPNEAVHTASSTGIAKLLDLVPSSELTSLADRLPGAHYYSTSSSWGRLKPKQATKYLKATEDVPVACLLSLHRNGYVRQAAERFLSGIHTGQEIRFLLARQNDWVDAIAESAQAEILERLTVENLGFFVKETRLLLHSLNYRRRDLSKTVDQYIDVLVSSNQPKVLQQAINACDKYAARKIYRLLLARNGGHLNHTIRLGLDSDDAVIRQMCLRHAKDCVEVSQFNEVATKLLRDKSFRVRGEAYEILALASPENSIKLWKKALLDRNRSVRQTAIYFLDQMEFDVASFYRKQLSSTPDSLPALSGLTDCGDQSDRPLFSRHLESPYASRRAEAVRGIARFGNPQDTLELQQALTDESKRVVRMAHQQLTGNDFQLDCKQLFMLLDQCKNLSGMKAILRLISDQGRWKALGWLVRAGVLRDRKICDEAQSLITELFLMNRVFTQPSREQRAEIERAIAESADAFPSSFRSTLKSYLASYRFSV